MTAVGLLAVAFVLVGIRVGVTVGIGIAVRVLVVTIVIAAARLAVAGMYAMGLHVPSEISAKRVGLDAIVFDALGESEPRFLRAFVFAAPASTHSS